MEEVGTPSRFPSFAECNLIRRVAWQRLQADYINQYSDIYGLCSGTVLLAAPRFCFCFLFLVFSSDLA